MQGRGANGAAFLIPWVEKNRDEMKEKKRKEGKCVKGK